VFADGEPTPEVVDEAVDAHRGDGVAVVVAVGGGSVIDAGKAISAMLGVKGSVADYIEGVGNPSLHPGTKAPLVAVPTTAGTGAEATKNAVLKKAGAGGFKRSLRHDNFIPDIALVDPELAVSCPPGVTAACGMDALTQLLESFVSPGASQLTDALAREGLSSIARSLIPAATDRGGDVAARSGMAYAALLSGITLANAGLGVVHGIAHEIGAEFEVPHGVACGAVLAEATAATIRRIEIERGGGDRALVKYAEAGEILAGSKAGDVMTGCAMLIDILCNWTEMLMIPRLAGFGVTETDAEALSKRSSNKSNPIDLTPDEINRIIRNRL
jgi:alcohol dehydrogenase class IV